MSAAVIRSNDPEFPLKIADRGLELVPDEAFKNRTTQKNAAIADLGNVPSVGFSPGSGRGPSM